MCNTFKSIGRGKVDVIGDIHGCFNELAALLTKLGYKIDMEAGKISGSPEGRKLIFLGDFTDRGSEPIKVLELVMDAVNTGKAYSVRGNHEVKLLDKLKKNTKAKEEVMLTINAIKSEGDIFKKRVMDFISGLPYVIVCGEDYLIAHAGLKEKFQILDSRDPKILGKIRALTIYGDTTGESHEDGRPVRLDWASEYKGQRAVIYGHSIIENVQWINNTINIDTGCFNTGILTVIRLPEREIIHNK